MHSDQQITTNLIDLCCSNSYFPFFRARNLSSTQPSSTAAPLQHSTNTPMAPNHVGIILVLYLCMQIASLVTAIPTSASSTTGIIQLPTSTSIIQLPRADSLGVSWSKEAIFTLIGVVVAVTSVLVTLLLASTRVRRYFRRPFDCKQT
jgi:hypothetical protein